MQAKRIDLRQQDDERINESIKSAQLTHKLNHCEPFTDEYDQLVKELFPNAGENLFLQAPIYVNLASNLEIGNNVAIMPYFKCMSAGKIIIEDDVQIAFNVAVITNDHDPYQRQVILVKDVHIKKNAWIGANATILSGVTIGENAIVGAGSIVTKDVPDNAVVVGSPAKVIKTLDKDKFKE